MSKTVSIHHCVFATKNRRDTIDDLHKNELCAYMCGILKNLGCHAYKINGYKNHLHIVFDLHPSKALSNVIKDLKVSSSLWIKNSGKFTDFDYWAKGYYASSVSYSHLNSVITYVRTQEEHHSANSFNNEIVNLMTKNGLIYHPDDLV